MTDETTIMTEWTNNPNGKIPVGSFCFHCGRFNTRNMTVTVIGVNAQNQVLLIQRKRDPESGAWAMPGGYVDWNETLSQTATREFFEETGLSITDPKFFGLYDDIHRDKDGRQNVDHCYTATIPDGQQTVPNPEEVIQLQWFSKDELPNNIAFDHKQMLEDFYGRQSS